MENQTPQTSSQASIEVPILKLDLTFADGFRFGCGFMAALLIFWAMVIVLSLMLVGIALLLGLTLPTIRF